MDIIKVYRVPLKICCFLPVNMLSEHAVFLRGIFPFFLTLSPVVAKDFLA